MNKINCKWITGVDDNEDPYCSLPEFEGACRVHKSEPCASPNKEKQFAAESTVKSMQSLYETSPEAYISFMVATGVPCPLEKTGDHDCNQCWTEYIEIAKTDPARALDMILDGDKE